MGMLVVITNTVYQPCTIKLPLSNDTADNNRVNEKAIMKPPLIHILHYMSTSLGTRAYNSGFHVKTRSYVANT